jgi:histidyl-tRNA synthetase
VWVASETSKRQRDVRRAATALRRSGVSVEYALRDQQLMKQVKAAKSAGAAWVLTLHDSSDDKTVGPRSWSPDPPPEWDRLLHDIGL